uniref:HD1-like protein n=1 Tax=Rhizophagus irregularis TaxID=588596 RepID=A0A141TLH8_9GLOM|nr:HD1-like protein [Rhizophagus irregularis]AMM02519.1 HD1-like protein [Rhizophagus irregularis]AMM02520.1 HD1-like protein [Rhizophagus irregularis]
MSAQERSFRQPYHPTQFFDQAQSFSTLPTHPQVNDVLFSLENSEIKEVNTNINSKTFNNAIRFEHHIMYPLLLKLVDHRDSLCYNTNLNELLSRTKELSAELTKIINVSDINMYSDLDKDIRSCISTVTYQIVEICNKEEDFRNDLVKIKNDMIEIISSQQGLPYSSISNIISYDNEPSKEIPTHNYHFEGKSKNIRQNMDPMAVLWFIKYLIDHKLEKPNKKHRFLLSLWTNVPEHDIDRWFIRTMSNYVKKLNNAEKVREKLKERAINTTRQLRKPNSLKTNSESRQVIPQRNSPYKRPTRGRKEKIKQ